MNIIIMPLPKCPYPKRIGPVKWADWYQGCKVAVQLQRSLVALGNNVEVLVLTNAQYADKPHEADVYRHTLVDLGARNVRVIRECYETTAQIKWVIEMARKERKTPIIVSTWLHFLRVAWLLRGFNVHQYVAFGIPHSRYAIIDVILTVVFPVIDTVPGGRACFVSWIERRRRIGLY